MLSYYQIIKKKGSIMDIKYIFSFNVIFFALAGTSCWGNVNNENANKNLLDAAFSGNLQLATTAIANGANVNITDHKGLTALMLAAKGNEIGSNKLPIVNLLLNNQAYVNVTDENGLTALHWAAREPYRKVSDNNAYGVLNRTVGEGIIEQLCNAPGINVDAKDHDGETPLMVAARARNPESVKALLAKNANKELRNNDNETALEIAQQQSRNEKVIDLL